MVELSRIDCFFTSICGDCKEWFFLEKNDGIIIFDESGLQKKGNDSVDVGKQYCRSIGKVESFQVGVFAGYASPKG